MKEGTTAAAASPSQVPQERGRRINWAEVATGEPLTRHLYYAHYRSMSLHVHVSMATLRAEHDERHFTHIDWRSNHSKSVDTIARACDVLIWASISTVGFMKLAKLRPVLREIRDTYSKLLKRLP